MPNSRLANVGKTCFLNSTLQALFFNDYFLGFELDNYCKLFERLLEGEGGTDLRKAIEITL